MDFAGQKAYIGVDLSKSYDLSSICIQFWKSQRCHSFFFHWVPAVGARADYRAHASLLDAWDKYDFCTIVETPTIDYTQIRDRLLWLCEHFDVGKDCIGIDGLSGLKPVLQEWEQVHNLPLVSIPQTTVVIGPATYAFESLIREGTMTIRRDPILEHCIQNVQLTTSVNGDRRPTKERSTGVIDAAIAGLQATAVAIEASAMQPPAYRTELDIAI